MIDRFFFNIESEVLRNGSVVIGRDKELCDFVINSPDISSRHARITERDGEYFIEDLNSEMGVEVTGQKLKPFLSSRISALTTFVAGKTEIELKILSHGKQAGSFTAKNEAPLRRSTNSRLGLFAMVIFFGLISIGMVAGIGFGYRYYQAWKAEEKIWLQAVGANEIPSFIDYMNAYPDGQYRDDAIQAIERIQIEKKQAEAAADTATFQLAKEINTLFAFETYINLYPQGKHLNTARSERERLRIEKEREEKQKAERLAWAKASKKDDLKSYQKYLKNHPNGPNAPAAKTKLELIKKADAEREAQKAKAEAQRKKLQDIDRDYKLARRIDTVASYRIFLRKHPDSDQEANIRNFIGFLYANGKSVAKDPTEGVRWFQEAAELGHKEAMMNLAYHYRFGLGVPKSVESAKGWYNKAAEAGHPYAKLHLKDLEKTISKP